MEELLKDTLYIIIFHIKKKQFTSNYMININ
jgi:hypothetical protein